MKLKIYWTKYFLDNSYTLYLHTHLYQKNWVPRKSADFQIMITDLKLMTISWLLTRSTIIKDWSVLAWTWKISFEIFFKFGSGALEFKRNLKWKGSYDIDVVVESSLNRMSVVMVSFVSRHCVVIKFNCFRDKMNSL